MKSIRTSITIDAPAEDVWRHLIDFDRHHEWNPFFASISGEPTVGTELTVVARKHLDVTRNETGMTFTPTVLVADPGVELRWAGKVAFGGLFDGTHFFCLHESDGVTTLDHGEDFRGILVPFVGRLLRNTEEGFVAFNRALKQRVEIGAVHRS